MDEAKDPLLHKLNRRKIPMVHPYSPTKDKAGYFVKAEVAIERIEALEAQNAKMEQEYSNSLDALINASRVAEMEIAKLLTERDEALGLINDIRDVLSATLGLMRQAGLSSTASHGSRVLARMAGVLAKHRQQAGEVSDG